MTAGEEEVQEGRREGEDRGSLPRPEQESEEEETQAEGTGASGGHHEGTGAAELQQETHTASGR